MKMMDNFKEFFFCLHTFDVRRSVDALDPENQSRSGALGLTKDVWHQKYEKKDFKII